MKRILLLNYCYPGQGTYYRCYYFGQHLAKAGHTVDLVCSSGKAWDMRIRSRKEGDNFTIITLPSPVRPGSGSAYILRTLIGLGWVLFKEYDIIHAFGTALPSTAIPAIAAGRLKRNVRIFLDWDDAWGEGYREAFGVTSRMVLRLLENKSPFWARPDCITTVSRHFKIRLLKMGFPVEKIFVIPNGSDTRLIPAVPKEEARRTIGWNEKGPLLLSMGHNYFDSLRILLEVFSLVLEKKPDAKLKMLGSLLKVGRYAEQTDAILKNFDGIKGSIKWIGEVPREKIGMYLCSADCLLLPMENSVMDEARAPIRIGDYLASGRPVVSNAVGYSREHLSAARPNGVSRDPDSRREFADKILAVLDDPELSLAIGKAGLKLAEGQYNWKNICVDMEKAYRI